MNEFAHTPGPWRWEYNAKHRSVQLVGGKPMYDLTVMDFERWGMHGAVPRFIEPSESMNGLMIMHRLCDRKDWVEPLPRREHHADWCAAVSHPDARLMAAAPELLKVLSKRVVDAEQRVFEDWLARTSPSGDVESVQDQWENSFEYSEFCDEWKVEHAAISKATGASHGD